MPPPPRTISAGRQRLHLVGIVVSGAGLLLFMSNFVLGPMAFESNRLDFDGHTRSMTWMGVRAFGGIILIVAGQILRNLARKGPAGAGLILDPEQEREDQEPFSRMQGGMLRDTLDEADLSSVIGGSAGAPAPTVKIRCLSCRGLNDEEAKFCNSCGARL